LEIAGKIGSTRPRPIKAIMDAKNTGHTDLGCLLIVDLFNNDIHFLR
jgi:hypothetical protein